VSHSQTANVYLALGTNLGDRMANLRAAVTALPPLVRILTCSPVYETEPWGFTNQPAFLNQALAGETDLSPADLLVHLKRLETTLGRKTTFHYGPRLIDIDVLFYDDLILETPTLILPHPRLQERAFVLVPLADIAPNLLHPLLGKSVHELLAGVDRKGVELFQSGTAMSHQNPWSDPSSTSAENVANMAAFLEQRSRFPDTVVIDQALCNVLAPKPGERLLEVGSGTGVLCRLIAPRLLPGGSITGMDISPEFARHAQRYAAEAGLADAITFETGNAESLPYTDGAFDGSFASRMLLHAIDPELIVHQLARVVRPGGRVVLMDWDFETVAVDHPDRALTRLILHWRTDNHGGDNWSGRQLWRRIVQAGLTNLEVTPVVTVARTEQDGLTQSLWRAAEVARNGGGISAKEHDAWIDKLKQRLVEGTFFASIVYFIVKGSVRQKLD
jgi:2-amino-4-hydroxy-6-hydroxymethyldihydropteridine diphosphokinase